MAWHGLARHDVSKYKVFSAQTYYLVCMCLENKCNLETLLIGRTNLDVRNLTVIVTIIIYCHCSSIKILFPQRLKIKKKL